MPSPLFLLEFDEQISLPLLGMLHLATHQFERLADANLGTQITHQHRIVLMQHLENLRAVHPLSLIFFLLFRNPEAVAYHRFQIVCLEERQVLLLDASHLVIGEPIRGMLMAKLIHNLCIELVIIDDRTIVYIFTRRNVKADVSAATGRVAERMLIVGGSQERSIAQLCR